MRAAILVTLVLVAATPVRAANPEVEQTKKDLEKKIEAQKEINKALKDRIRALEKKTAAKPAPPPALPAGEEGDRALKRALIRRGLAVLQPTAIELTPSLGWTHNGTEAIHSTDNLYTAAIDGRAGLQDGWMIGGTAPYQFRSTTFAGDNAGIGDVSAHVWKQLLPPGEMLPSLIGNVTYTAPTGENFSEASVPLGSGVHRVTGQLSAVKTIAPVAYWGSVSYTHNFTRSFNGVEYDRSGTYGFQAGATLAVTPKISFGTGVRFAFEGKTKRNGAKIPGSGFTSGVVQVETGVALSRDVFLLFTGAFGVTNDAPDVSLGVSLPIRF